MKVYIFRHQEGDPLLSNCLNATGVRHSARIADFLASRNASSWGVHSCVPDTKGRHIRPMQTASILCSRMSVPLNLVFSSKDVRLPSKGSCYDNHVIVWHHRGVPDLLRNYVSGAVFEWPTTNFKGCLVIDLDTSRFKFFYDYIDVPFDGYRSRNWFGFRRMRKLLCF